MQKKSLVVIFLHRLITGQQHFKRLLQLCCVEAIVEVGQQGQDLVQKKLPFLKRTEKITHAVSKNISFTNVLGKVPYWSILINLLDQYLRSKWWQLCPLILKLKSDSMSLTFPVQNPSRQTLYAIIIYNILLDKSKIWFSNVCPKWLVPACFKREQGASLRFAHKLDLSLQLPWSKLILHDEPCGRKHQFHPWPAVIPLARYLSTTILWTRCNSTVRMSKLRTVRGGVAGTIWNRQAFAKAATDAVVHGMTLLDAMLKHRTS